MDVFFTYNLWKNWKSKIIFKLGCEGKQIKLTAKNEKFQISYNENSFIYVLESIFKIILWKVLSFYRKGNQFKEVKQQWQVSGRVDIWTQAILLKFQ